MWRRKREMWGCRKVRNEDTQNSSFKWSGEVRVCLGGGDVDMQEDVEAMEGRDTQNSSSRGSGEVRVGGGDVETQERDVGM